MDRACPRKIYREVAAKWRIIVWTPLFRSSRPLRRILCHRVSRGGEKERKREKCKLGGSWLYSGPVARMGREKNRAGQDRHFLQGESPSPWGGGGHVYLSAVVFTSNKKNAGSSASISRRLSNITRQCSDPAINFARNEISTVIDSDSSNNFAYSHIVRYLFILFRLTGAKQ